MLYFTSDTHLGHNNIIKYCNRPFKDTKEMNKTIVDNWNSTVTKHDIVFHLGDVALNNDALQLVSRLNGIKWLLRGNHDRSYSDTKLKAVGFSEIFHKAYSFVRFYDDLQVFIQCMHAPIYFRKNYINLCGHIHDRWTYDKGYLNVGVDSWDFYPLSLTKIIEIYQDRFPNIEFTG